MSPKEKQSRVFSYLQEAELEMSRKDVRSMVEKLPHLPLPKGGHPLSIRIGLNLNSIIMNSILFISILSGLIYFSQAEEKQIEAIPTVAIEESSGQNESPYREIDTREIENFELLDLDQANLAESTEPNLPEEVAVESTEESPASKEEEVQTNSNEASNTMAGTGRTETNVEAEVPQLSGNQLPEGIEKSERMKRSFKGTNYYNHNSPVKISEADIKLLKKDLLKQLKADGYVKGRKLNLAIYCLPEGIQINEQVLTEAKAAAYESFLKAYSIPTAPQRQIRLIDKFILIGDFDEEGDMQRGTLQGSGSIELDDLDPIEDNYPLFSDKAEKELTLDDGPCAEPLNVADNITQLKIKLKKMLRSDDLFSARRDETRIWFPKEGIAVNEKLIPEAESGDYLELLREYGVKPCAARIIQITADYVAVGDMVDGRFKGRIHGSFDLTDLNNIKLKESIND